MFIVYLNPPAALLRYVFPFGKTGRIIEAGEICPAAPLKQLRPGEKPGELPSAGTTHPPFFEPRHLLRASIFPKGKLSLKGGGWV